MKIIISILLIALFLAGCVTTKPFFQVNINSISNNEPMIGRSCFILSGLKDVDINDLQFQEYASYVKRALTLNGYRIADRIENADIAVFLAYGIGDPQQYIYTYSAPVWGQRGISSATTWGAANTQGTATSYGRDTNIQGSTTYWGKTTYKPQYGIVGSETNIGSFVTYTRYIILDVYDLNLVRELEQTKQIWKTEIVSTGASGDLRYVFPVLIGAAYPYLGLNTGRKIQVSLTEDNEHVLRIKRINEVSQDNKKTQDTLTDKTYSSYPNRELSKPIYCPYCGNKLQNPDYCDECKISLTSNSFQKAR